MKSTQRLWILLVFYIIGMLATACGGKDTSAPVPNGDTSISATTAPTPAPERSLSQVEISPLNSPLLTPTAGQATASSYVDAGMTAFNDGDYDEAFQLFSKATALDENMSSAHAAIGMLYVTWRRFPEALDAYSKAIELERTADNLIGRCNVYRLLLRTEEALQDCNEAIALKPDDTEIYLVLSSLYLENKDYAQARAQADNVLRLDPENDKAVFTTGMIDLAEGLADNAYDKLSESISMNSKEPRYYWERGFLSMALGKIDQARKDMHSVLDVADPKKHGDLMLFAGSQLEILGEGK